MQVGDRHMADDTKQAFWYAALILMQLRQGPLVGPEGDDISSVKILKLES